MKPEKRHAAIQANVERQLKQAKMRASLKLPLKKASIAPRTKGTP